MCYELKVCFCLSLCLLLYVAKKILLNCFGCSECNSECVSASVQFSFGKHFIWKKNLILCPNYININKPIFYSGDWAVENVSVVKNTTNEFSVCQRHRLKNRRDNTSEIFTVSFLHVGATVK